MPMKALVTNVGGRAIAETRDGTRRLMQHDAMGNVIALINDAGVVTDTYEYWPFGEIRTQTGTSNNPWKFGGAWGYYTDASGRQYVRARTLRNDLGRWITVDPLWPSEPAYGCAGNSPLVNVDPSGTVCIEPKQCCCSFLGGNFFIRPTNKLPEFYGHIVSISLDMQNVEVRRPPYGACKLKWLEKTNIRNSNVRNPINKWFDPEQLGLPLGFKNPTGCPSRVLRFLYDDPAGTYNVKPSTSLDVKLCIRIILTDGCTKGDTVKTFKIRRVIKKGKAGGLYPPLKDPTLDSYCKYP